MYCVSVSKKIGKAHTRNLIKRRVKDILMKNKLFLKRKYVIIVKKEALDASYEDLTKVLINQIKGAK
jgi:ribonuclease P protein component